MITHDNWQRIKEIFDSAQKLSAAERPDFLDHACGDDTSLREEVEALLTADASNEDFLNSPAYHFAAEILVETEFSAGQEIGRYTVLCPLGFGGMGQIYLAEDAKLKRKIALKFISQQFATDPQRVQRFEQEALAASALNHPNICVIHELGITETGRHFIAMEYIQGITLRDQLSRGPLPTRQALNIAIQVATALSSAHASRIVHRDIKPENLMVRPDGYVKVLDFGLAKLTEILPVPETPLQASKNVTTEAGTLMGTVKYMSPEQLREAKVDERSDIWSLGVVLYEMLTGSTPFEASTPNETIAAIRAAQPPSLEFSDHIPGELRHVIGRALEKDRDRRYQTISKFAADLKELQAKLQGQSTVDLTTVDPLSDDDQQTRRIESSGIFTRIKSQALYRTEFLLSGIRSHKKAALFTGVSSVLVVLLFVPAAVRNFSSLFNSNTVQSKMTSVTNAGTSVCSAISSDGKWVAHAEERGGKQWLVLTDTATAKSSEIIAASEVQYLGISFTRESNYLYFTRLENSRGMLYRLALSGGPPVKIKDGVDSPISFSPQQDQFAFVRHDKNTLFYSLVVSPIDGSSEQILATRQNGDALSIYGPAWSPDGNLIVCPIRSWTNGFKVSLIAIDVNNGREKLLSDQPWFTILQIAWLDDMSGLIISARDQATAPDRLWRISYPDAVSQQLTSDLADYRGVSIAGRDIVTVRNDWTWDLIVTDSTKDSAHPSTIASGVGVPYGVTWAGSNRIVFSAMAQDTLNIARINSDGSDQVPLTVKSKDNYSPATSSDGRFVVFTSNRTGTFDIWRMNIEDASDLKQLTFSNGNFYPTISPDNEWVAYDNQTSKQKSIWKVPLRGGKETKVADGYRMPAFSPDNQFIAARYDLESGTTDVAILYAGSGELWKKIPVPNFDWQRVQWLSQNTLSYIEKINGFPNIVSYDIASGEKKQLTYFNRNRIFSYAWSPDYKLLACQLGTKTTNIVRIKNDK
ncbi:MAG TPA: protein kinase [Pyrinomonadaceae bacterium]|nr:protein kinase [Pyrinomonadaceae bacterium]